MSSLSDEWRDLLNGLLLSKLFTIHKDFIIVFNHSTQTYYFYYLF